MYLHDYRPMHIINRKGGRYAGRETAAPEAFFQIAGSTRLYLRSQIDDPGAEKYLSQRIKQKPKDLRAHMQRIFQMVERADELRLFGALVDLFIVLGVAGEPVKQRCLTNAEPVLTGPHLAFLERALEQGLQAHDPSLSQARHSVLSRGIKGQLEIVRKVEATERAYAGPYEEAVSFLEYGQIDQARRVLEKSLYEANDDPRIPAQLLEIYQHAEDYEAIETMRAWLANRYVALPEG